MMNAMQAQMQAQIQAQIQAQVQALIKEKMTKGTKSQPPHQGQQQFEVGQSSQPKGGGNGPPAQGKNLSQPCINPRNVSCIETQTISVPIYDNFPSLSSPISGFNKFVCSNTKSLSQYPLDNSLFSFPKIFTAMNSNNTSSTAVKNTLPFPQEVHASSPLPTNLAQAHVVKKLRNGKMISDPYECVEERKVTDYSSLEEEDHRIESESEKEEELEDGREKMNEANNRELLEKENNLGQNGQKEPIPSSYSLSPPFPKALGRLKPLLEGNPLLHSLKDTTITIPLEDAIQYIPTFTKYVKDLVTLPRKKKLVKLSERISSIMLGELPEKKCDPGAHLITCKIRGNKFEKTLLDSGASINLMPKSIYDKFKFGDLEPIGLTLQMANGSTSPACGILEDFKFHIDLVVADVSDKGDPSQIPLILGRPFLATAKAITDWDKGEVKIKVGDEEIQLSLTKLMKKPQASIVDVFTCDLEEEIRIEEEELVEEFKKEEKEEGESKNPIPLAGDTHDLKPLPSSLKYAF